MISRRASHRLRWLLCAILVFGFGCKSTYPQQSESPLIRFETHGFDLGGGNGAPVYELTVFADGTVVYDGRYRTRVSGEVRERVTPVVVARWLKDLQESGAFDVSERPGYIPPADSTWFRLTVDAGGRRNIYRFHGWNTSFELVRTLDQILAELDVHRRWVTRNGGTEVLPLSLPKRVKRYGTSIERKHPAPEAQKVLVELPLKEKIAQASVIVVGEIADVTWEYPDRVSPMPESPGAGTRVLAVVKPVRTLKSPEGSVLKGDLYVPLGGRLIDGAPSLSTTWSALRAFYIGRRFIFFAHDVTELGAGAYAVSTGYTVRPEPHEREQEIRALLR